MFEQPCIPCHECRRGEPKDLPEGKVPWHYSEDHTERLKDDVASRRTRADLFFAQIARGVLRVMPTDRGALCHLGDGGFERFPHLERDQPAVLLFPFFENCGGTIHSLRAISERSCGKARKRFRRSLQGLFDRIGGMCLINGERFAGCGILR